MCLWLVFLQVSFKIAPYVRLLSAAAGLAVKVLILALKLNKLFCCVIAAVQPLLRKANVVGRAAYFFFVLFEPGVVLNFDSSNFKYVSKNGSISFNTLPSSVYILFPCVPIYFSA